MKTRALPLALAVTLFAAGCGTGGEEQAETPAADTQQTTAPAETGAAEESPGESPEQGGGEAAQVIVVDAARPAVDAAPAVEDDPVAEEYDLTGQSVVEIVDWMDETNEHRGSGLNGSIRYDHLMLTDEDGTESEIPVPDDLFYVSVAPYETQTHECFNHSLTGCTGEFFGEEMEATVTDDAGEVLYEGTVTTFENGFVGFWLPRDIEGTMEFTYDGMSVSAPFATDADSPTCITTMQLT